MDEALVASIKSPGMRPGLQRRSRETAARLIGAGVELLDTNDFADLSIELVCATAEVTVGSFYARFDSRDAYLVALQRLVFEQARQQIEAVYAGALPGDSLDNLLAYIVRATIAWYRKHEGFLRAMLRQAGQQPDSWAPLRDLGRLQAERALPHIAKLAGRKMSVESQTRLAFQVLHGTLNNMVQIDPGPLRLHDRGAAHQLSAVLAALIGR